MPETTTHRPRTTERRVAHLRILYQSKELGPDGSYVEYLRSAQRGDLVTLSLVEAARLDALGSLAPVGYTTEQIDADVEAMYSAYQSARRGVPEM